MKSVDRPLPNSLPELEEAKEVLEQSGIKVLLFDLDDTLNLCSATFKSATLGYFRALAERLGFSPEEEAALSKSYIKHVTDGYFINSVNPKNQDYVIEQMKAEFQGRFSEEELAIFDEAAWILHNIFNTTPDLKENVLETLQILRQTGVPLILVTHANREWTIKKLAETGLWLFFDEIYIIEEDKYKDEEEWEVILKDIEERFGIAREGVHMTGDNVKGDIISPYARGVRKLAWISNGSDWGPYRNHEIPTETSIIEGIEFLIPELRNRINSARMPEIIC
jgi:FMN phosphatase YigB (HAD superfamily)